MPEVLTVEKTTEELLALPGFTVNPCGDGVFVNDPDNTPVGFVPANVMGKYPELYKAIQQHCQNYRERNR